MKAIIVRWLIILLVLAAGYLAFLDRYSIGARIWHWRHGYSARMGNYEVPVPDHWVILSQGSTSFTLANTAPNLPRDHKFHTTAVIDISPFRNRPIGKDGLEFWLSLHRKHLEREGVETVEEKNVAFGGDSMTCIGGAEMRTILRRGNDSIPTDVISLRCLSSTGLEILFLGEPSDLQPFYTFASQIRRYQ